MENAGLDCSSLIWARNSECCFSRYFWSVWICASWFVRFCDVDVCLMSVCAIVSAFAEGVLRTTVVDARALNASDPSGVRCVFIVSSIFSSSGCFGAWSTSASLYDTREPRCGPVSYLVQLLQCFSFQPLLYCSLLICTLVCHR